ncbi:hypothetical protein DE4585_01899 [Mycobacteroides salmoniphilum]|uniref:Uncharacterized protein n=1 Tax=Mycobacteroides salmoniphilum TaxID=404941 RepID=A0A4R8S2C3_9MYCO|nr:hypothetical protein [Mycobacteroides salmoniphilum]TDZ75528.1 hypothetical protein DE4586_03421 [Mycobacteroides salmoniphilum]TDZ83104.1 hypothetical protein DE4585_01899 [Mycobacteroides salmoniphilum]TDZ84047.1 hypothetical protein DE4587_02963 [Mycobacteroides salmoniphilum]
MDEQPALDADLVFTIASHFDQLDVADAEAAVVGMTKLAPRSCLRSTGT